MRLLTSVLITIFISLTNVILAQSQPWKPICVASKGTSLFMGTDSDGILYSDNAGNGKWTPKNNGLPISGRYVQTGMKSYCPVTAICINESNVFALVQGGGRNSADELVFGGVYLSVNNGASWTAKNNGFPGNCEVITLASSGTTMLAGTVAHGVYKSSDNGNTWIPANVGMEKATINSLCIVGQNIYAGAAGAVGIFLSTDNGASWRKMNKGLPLSQDKYEFAGYQGVSSPSITSITTSGKSIFCVVNCGTGDDTNGVFRSNDNGITWTNVSNGLPRFALVSSVIACGTSLFTKTIDGEIYISNDNGGLWTKLETKWPCILSEGTTSLVATGTKLFAATGCLEVFMSINGGTSWTKVNNDRIDPK